MAYQSKLATRLHLFGRGISAVVRFWNQQIEFQDTSPDDVTMWDNFADHSGYCSICFEVLRLLWVIVAVLATVVVGIGSSFFFFFLRCLCFSFRVVVVVVAVVVVVVVGFL